MGVLSRTLRRRELQRTNQPAVALIQVAEIQAPLAS
jgi:hypothetical protein